MTTPMSADDQFYREYILDHYKNPRNFGRLEHPDITHEEDNPLCGDVVGMDFRVKDGMIEDVRFHGRGCAISQASASLLTERLKGMPLDDAKKINKDDVLGELGIEISPARIKCALLSLKVLKVGAYGLAGDDGRGVIDGDDRTDEAPFRDLKVDDDQEADRRRTTTSWTCARTGSGTRATAGRAARRAEPILANPTGAEVQGRDDLRLRRWASARPSRRRWPSRSA